MSTDGHALNDLAWKRFCSGSDPNCIEAAPLGDLVALRNSTLPEYQITGTKAELAALIAAAKNGEMDYLVR